MEKGVLTSCGPGRTSQTSMSRDSTCDKTLQKSYGSMRTQKSHCLTSPVVLELLSRLGLETLSTWANERQCSSLSEESEASIAASGASGQQKTSSNPLGRRASIALTSAWLSPRFRQLRMGGGQQVVSQQQSRHERLLVAELGGSGSREDSRPGEGRPTAITTLRSPSMSQHSPASPDDRRSTRKLCSSCTTKKLQFKCDNPRAVPPSGPAFTPAAAAKDPASRAVNFSDASKQKMGSKAMKSITKRSCDTNSQQYDNTYSMAVSSLATRVCPAPPEAPGAKTSVKCTTTVQYLQRQLLLAIQQYILKQFAGANTPRAATLAEHTDTTSYEAASQCGDCNAQHPCSQRKRVIAHSAASDASATIQRRIPLAANFVFEQKDDIESSVGRTYELEQLLPLAQPLLRPTERGVAMCHYPSTKTGDVDRYIQRIRATQCADGDSSTDCVPTSNASKVERRYPNSGTASFLAARGQTGMASLTAALLRAMDRLREPHTSSVRSLCTPQSGHEDEHYRSNSHAYSEESSNSTNSSFSNTSDSGSSNSGSSNSGTNNSHVAGDTAKSRKATTAAECTSDALDISKAISEGMVDGSDAGSTRETLLLVYARLLKALLRDVACTGQRNALKTGAARQGFLENASSFSWKDHELNAAATKLCFRRQAVVQHEQASLLDAAILSATEQKNFEASAPHPQRLLSVSHRKRQGQHRATGLSQLPQTGKTQPRHIVEGVVSPNYDCLPQRPPKAAATKVVQVEQECAAPEKEPSLAEKPQSTGDTAASACADVSGAKNGLHNAGQMRLKEPCATGIGAATHDQDVLQLLLRTHEYLRRLRNSASPVPCEKTGKAEGACAPSGRQQVGPDVDAVCGNHAKRRQERCDQTASNSDASAAFQAEEGRDSSALQHREPVHSPSEVQETQSLPRSRPLNPNAAPFVPRLALASSITVGLPPSLTCRNAFTSADHPQQFTSSFSGSVAAGRAASGCPEVWNMHDLPLREQPRQQARSLCSPSGSSPAAPLARSGGQSQDHQEGGTLRPTHLRNNDCEKHQRQSAITREQAFFERYLQRLLQHYVQHQSLDRVADKLWSLRGDSTVTPTGTPAHHRDAEVSSTSRVPPSAKSLQYASWVKEREMLCDLEQRRTQGMPKTREVAARVAASGAPLCTRDADESQHDAQTRPLDESSRGLHPERTFLKETQNVGLPPSSGSGVVQKSLEPSAALQQLLLYFRREQCPEYLVASKVLQQLAASVRHPHSSPLPPALEMFCQLRSASGSIPYPSAQAATTSCAGSRKDDCLEVPGKARTPLATARTLLQASARDEVVYRTTGNFNKQVAVDTRTSDKVKTSTNTSVFSVGTPEIPHPTNVGSRLNDGRVEGLLESAVLQQLQSSQRQQQLQECLLQGRQPQAFGLNSQNSSRLPYQPALQAALANLLHGTAESSGVEARPQHLRVQEPNALKMDIRAPHLQTLLQQLKHIHGLAKAQSAQRPCHQEEREQASHSDLPREINRNTTDAVSGTSGHFATIPPSHSTVPKETAENSESEEGFTEGSSTRIYTKLELLQTFNRMRKREQLSYGQVSDGLSQRTSCEDNLFFKVMPLSRSQVDSGHPHRPLHHQHPTRQHQQEETEQQQRAAANADSHETSTQTAGQGGVHTLTETRACIKSFLPAAKPFQHNLSPSAVVDRPSPPNILRYFLSPKNGSEHSSTSTGDSTLTDGAVACEVSSTKSSVLKSAERTSSRVAFPAPRVEALRANSQESWSQFERTDCCLSRLPTPQSSDSGPQSTSTGAAEVRSNVEADCFSSPAPETCGSSRPLSVSSAHLALQRPTERNCEIQQPNTQKEGWGGSGSRHRGPCESGFAEQPCEQKEPPPPAVNKLPDTSASVRVPFAEGGAVPTSAGDHAAVQDGNKQQNSLLGVPSRQEHDHKELTHHATSSTTAATPDSRAGGDATRISNEPYSKQKPLPSQHSCCSASVGAAIGTPEQRSSNEDAVRQESFVGKQQHTASSPQNTSSTAKISIRQPVQADRVTSVSTNVATIAAGKISEKRVQSPSHLSRKTAPSESSTGGETSTNTEKTHDEAASRRAPAVVNAPMSESTTETTTTRASQSPHIRQSLESRSKYLLVYKEKSKSDTNQVRKPVPLRACPTSATKTLARPQQIPTASGPDVFRGPLVSGASKRANQARKSTRDSRGAAAAAPSALTLYVRARKSDDVRTTEKKPHDFSHGADEHEETPQIMKTTAHGTGAMPQSAQSYLNHATESHSSIVRIPTTFLPQQCRSTGDDEVASATAVGVAGNQADGENQTFAKKAGKIEAEAEGAPYVVQKGQVACDQARAPHCGDTRTSETPDSACSTTTAEVAPTAVGGAQDQHQFCVMKPTATREKQKPENQAPGVLERSACSRPLAKHQEITFPGKRLTATDNFCPANVQQPKQLCRAREKSGAVFLTPKSSSIDLTQSQKREKQEKQLHNMGGELTPRNHHGREADTSQKQKCDLYVKRKELVAQGRISSHALAQQHNVDYNTVHVGQGRKTVPWAVAAGAAGASSTAVPSGAKRTSIDTDPVTSARPCRYIPSIHSDTQSGERW